jgi:flavin-dependent dehydrogenase
VSRARPVIVTVQRSAFDQLLVRKAMENGAVFMPETALLSLVMHGDQLEAVTAEGPFACQWVIAADGALGKTTHMAGWKHKLETIPAVEAEINMDAAALEHFKPCIRFDFGPIQNGYAWMFPKKNAISIGMLSFKTKGASLNRSLDEYVRFAAIPAGSMVSKTGAAIPVCPLQGGFAKNRVLVTGDAAGLADPVTCEGISNALKSGAFAAQAIIDGRSNRNLVLKTYDDLVNNNIIKDLRASRLLARLIYNFPGIRRWLFKKYGQDLCEAVADILTGKRSYSTELFSLSNYLKLITDR